MRKLENRCFLWGVFKFFLNYLEGRGLRELVKRGMMIITLQKPPTSPNLSKLSCIKDF
jgi:hypothetical protein